MEETPYPVPPLPENHLSGFIMSMPESQPATETQRAPETQPATETQPAPETQPARETQPAPESQPALEKADCSSRPSAADSTPHLRYKRLLNKFAQYMKIPPPVYQTKNEGSDHIQRFRSTVCVDGESYTSSSVFRERRMSETDASKLAYIAITQKAKTEALHFIQEDNISCKSIMADFAAMKCIRKPVYKTTEQKSAVPVFCSSMFFNGVTYPGDNGKTKNEAEQLVARSVIIKYLDSEDGHVMAIIVYYKLRQCHEMKNVQEINSVQNGSVLEAQTGVGHDVALTESGDNTMVKSSATPELSLVQGTVVPATAPSSDVPQPNLVLTPVPSAVVNNSCSSVVSAPLVETPATNNSFKVIQQPIPEASSDQTSVKKRKRRGKKNSRKKMHADSQTPVVPASQVCN